MDLLETFLKLRMCLPRFRPPANHFLNLSESEVPDANWSSPDEFSTAIKTQTKTALPISPNSIKNMPHSAVNRAEARGFLIGFFQFARLLKPLTTNGNLPFELVDEIKTILI